MLFYLVFHSLAALEFWSVQQIRFEGLGFGPGLLEKGSRENEGSETEFCKGLSNTGKGLLKDLKQEVEALERKF